MHLHKIFNFNISIFLGDKQFIIPIINGIGLSHQNTKLDWMSEIIFILHGLKNGAIIDVGANIGQSLLKTKSLLSNITYVGIEPSPECNLYLHHLIKKNNLNYCTIVPIGLSNKASLEAFITTSEADEGASIIPEIRPERKAFRKQFIPAFPFDEVDTKINCEDISIIKIDVEGAELLVLEGMKNTLLKKNIPFIICEILHAHSENELAFSERKNLELLALIQGLGYSAFRIIKKSEEEGLEGLEEIKKIDNLVWNKKLKSRLMCDYLFVKNEYTSLVKGKIRQTKYSETALKI
jgi:FkbM family methyltransferase